MVFGAVKYLIVGILCIVLGLATWKKHDLSLIHSPYYGKVSPENIQPEELARLIVSGLRPAEVTKQSLLWRLRPVGAS